MRWSVLGWGSVALLAALVGCHVREPAEATEPVGSAAGRGEGGAAGSAVKVTATAGRGDPSPIAGGGGMPPRAGAPAPEPTQPMAALAFELTKLSSCDDAEQALRDAALADMNTQLDQNLASYLAQGAGPCALAGSPNAASGDAMKPAPSAVSTTNNQVASVDEADFIKNDERYIYRVGHGALTVLEAWPAASTHPVGRIAIEGTPTKLFVAADRAVVYVSLPSGGANAAKAPTGGAIAPRSGGTCSYGYGCRFEGDGSDTAILVFDLSDRTSPKLLRRFDINASLIAARRIGTTVHTVVANAAVTFPIQTTPTGLSYCTSLTPEAKEVAKTAYEKLRTENAEIIRTTPISDFLPILREDGQAAPELACDDIYRAVDSGSAYTILLSFDMAQSAVPTQATIVSRPGAVYASADTLYVAVPQAQASNQPWFNELANAKEASTIHAFRIGTDPKATAYLGSGLVKGRVLNQFAMDEHEGVLRIATTLGHLPDPNTHNTLSVLRLVEGTLELQGQIDDIAKGEDIRSVRFDRDRGFMVTFKKTDPLFAFDLADPKHPKVLGELKIPGFSTYIHMLDADHLLTIGYDAMDHGDFAYFDGVLLQIFDVSHPEAPTLQHKATIGTRGSSSEALADHLAFTLFQGKLALPMTICEGGGDGSYGTDMTFSGLIIYDVSVDGGFVERGRVANPQLSGGQYDSSLCSNWWSSASSEIKRSIFMDDFVYAVAPNVLHVQDTRALGKDVATVRFDTPAP